MNFIFLNQTQIPKWRHYKQPLTEVFLKTLEVFQLDQNTHVSCVLIDQETMKQYNAQYRDKDRPTDVLTFVDDQEEHYLGDVLINVDAVVSQAQEYGHSLKREISFLFAHGLLHTLGFDHQTPEDEQIMIAAQKEILSHVPKRRHRTSAAQI